MSLSTTQKDTLRDDSRVIDVAAHCDSLKRESDHFDVAIVGGGLAGHWAAQKLDGARTVILEPRSEPAGKSLLVHGSRLSEYDLFEPIRGIERGLFPIKNYDIFYPDKNWGKNAFCDSKLDNPAESVFSVEQSAILRAVDGARPLEIWKTRVRSIRQHAKDKMTLTLDNGQEITAEYVIDTSGSYTPVSRHRIFDQQGNHIPLITDDPVMLWCYGERVQAQAKEMHTLFYRAGSEIGAGSWILPYGDGEVDIISASYCRLSDLHKIPRRKIYEKFFKYACREGIIENIEGQSFPVSGAIRMQPITPEATSLRNVIIMGDAAGMGSPAFGEVIPFILEGGDKLSQVIKKNGSAYDFYKKWRHGGMLPYSAEQVLLIQKVKQIDQDNGDHDWEVCSGAGSRIELYDAVIKTLPEHIQHQFLIERHIPKRYIPHLAWGLLSNPQSRAWATQFAKDFAYAKLCEWRGEMLNYKPDAA
jgi:flavin-dependent dehydrogenase